MIISTENKLIKHANLLKQKKHRDSYNEFLAEGLRNVLDIIKQDYTKVKYVFVSSGQKDIFLQKLKNMCESEIDKKALYEFINNRLVVASDKVLNKLSDTVTPQEIVAIVEKKQESCNFGDFCIYLDRIQDPGNLGTIIRSAIGAGFFVIFDNCVDVFSPKVVRSSMSAIMALNFIYAKQDTLLNLKDKGYFLACADSSGKNLFEFEKKEKICVVIGNEANGISKDIINICDGIISIPMQNNIESLNAAVSSAIFMYHLRYSK